MNQSTKARAGQLIVRDAVIEDPNRPLVLWESSAIITYLVQEYDKNHSLTYAEGDEVHHINQWLHFQTSGQGPYYGQAAWYVPCTRSIFPGKH